MGEEAGKKKKSFGSYGKGGAVILIIGTWVILSLVLKPLNKVGKGGDPLTQNVAPAIFADLAGVALVIVTIAVSVKIWKNAKSE